MPGAGPIPFPTCIPSTQHSRGSIRRSSANGRHSTPVHPPRLEREMEKDEEARNTGSHSWCCHKMNACDPGEIMEVQLPHLQNEGLSVQSGPVSESQQVQL